MWFIPHAAEGTLSVGNAALVIVYTQSSIIGNLLYGNQYWRASKYPEDVALHERKWDLSGQWSGRRHLEFTVRKNKQNTVSREGNGCPCDVAHDLYLARASLSQIWQWKYDLYQPNYLMCTYWLHRDGNPTAHLNQTPALWEFIEWER